MYRFCFTQKQREVSVLFQPYETVAGYASDEFVERKSRFIGHIAPVKDEAEALDFLSQYSEQNIGRPPITYSLIFLRESGVKAHERRRGAAGHGRCTGAGSVGTGRSYPCSGGRHPLFWLVSCWAQAVWCGLIPTAPSWRWTRRCVGI